jgi:dihydrofolate synthase/folylpolyglutamate synthase
MNTSRYRGQTPSSRRFTSARLARPRADFAAAERFLHSLVVGPKPHYVSEPATKPPPFTLDRLRSLLRAMGRPDRGQRFIHITGTSGKTSTATISAALLTAHDCRTALHISPHMDSVTERFTIDGTPASEDEVAELVEEIKPLLDEEYRRHRYGAPSYFELVLALALRYFAESGVDWTVLEAGLGGRFDGTNVIDAAAVSIITCIGLDHCNVLGNTKAEIAHDKVGIVKHGGVLLTADTDPAILRIFEAEVLRHEARLEVLGRELELSIRREDREVAFDYRSPQTTMLDLRLSGPGAFQARNAALALRACELALQTERRSLDPERCALALRMTRVPGRMELVQDTPPVILDGAHNPDKMAAFVEDLGAHFPNQKFEVVYAATSGRDLERILASIGGVARRLFITRPMATFRVGEDPKGLAELVERLCPDLPVELFLDPIMAWRAARAESVSSGNGVVITGSLYLLSALRKKIKEDLA